MLPKKAPASDVDVVSHQMAGMRLTDKRGQSELTFKPSPRPRTLREETQCTTSTPPCPAASSVDELALEIAERLTIKASSNMQTSKGKEKENISDEKVVAIRSLQCIQKTSQMLSDAVQLGWRASAPSKSYTKQALHVAVAEAAVNIQTLRESPFSRTVDVERTVIHMAGRLSSLELVRISLSERCRLI